MTFTRAVRNPVGSGLLAAILLAWFTAGSPLQAQGKRKRSPVLKGGSEIVLPVEVEGAEGMDFHLHLPRGWKRKTRKTYPALLALHGNGQAAAGNFRTCCRLSQKKTPLIVIAPAYQKEKRFNAPCWPQDVCMKAFDWLRRKAVADWHADPDRFFVQGFSMGGSYASFYLLHEQARRKEGASLPIRGVVLNSGVALNSRATWPPDVPSLFIVGELETAVLGKVNVVQDMRRAANVYVRQGADVRFHLIPGMKHTVNPACLDLARQLLFEECEPVTSVSKEIAAFKKQLKKEVRPVTRLKRIEKAARSLPPGSATDRTQRSLAALYDLPNMKAELEAWKHWDAAVEADRSGGAARSRPLFEALLKSHPRTEAGRRAQSRLTYLE